MISLLSLDIMYSTQQKEYSQGNQIKTYLFEWLKTKKIAASTRKKAERSDLAQADQAELIGISCGFIFYKFYPLGIYKCTNNEFEFLKLQNILQIKKKKNRLLDQAQKLFPEKV